MLFSEISKQSGTGELDAIADSVEQSHPIFLLQLLYVLALHILHRQPLETAVSEIAVSNTNISSRTNQLTIGTSREKIIF